MKKYILLSLLTLSLFGLFSAGVMQSLLFFLLTGAIPGTKLSLSPEIMGALLVAIAIAFGAGIAVQVMAKLVALSQRYLLRKRLLTIPAFRRQIHIRQAKSPQPTA